MSKIISDHFENSQYESKQSKSMKVLEICIDNFQLVGLCTKPYEVKKNEFLRTFRSWICVIGFFSLFIVASGVYLIRYYSDVTSSMNALEVFAGGIEGLGAFVTTGFMMLEVKCLLDRIQKITDKGKMV